MSPDINPLKGFQDMGLPLPPLTLFLHLRALPAWLALSRSERHRIGAEAIGHALADTGVTYRHFDAEAFSAACSDIAVLEAADHGGLNRVMERLRDSAIFARPYFEVVSIIPAMEDGFRHFEQGEARS